MKEKYSKIQQLIDGWWFNSRIKDLPTFYPGAKEKVNEGALMDKTWYI